MREQPRANARDNYHGTCHKLHATMHGVLHMHLRSGFGDATHFYADYVPSNPIYFADTLLCFGIAFSTVELSIHAEATVKLRTTAADHVTEFIFDLTARLLAVAFIFILFALGDSPYHPKQQGHCQGETLHHHESGYDTSSFIRTT
jgi:hypothetical protein